MNFILIFSDGWRADFANDVRFTPNLHKFLAKYGGYKFLNAYSTTTWTWAATMSMFTSLLPVQHGCDDIGYQKHDAEHRLAPDIWKAVNCSKDNFLMTRLKKRGYITKTFDNPTGIKYLKGTGQVHFDKEIVQLWDRYALLDMTEEKIEEPFFYFVRITDAGHAPWGKFPRDSKEEFDKAVATGKFPSEHTARRDPTKWSHERLIELLGEQCVQWDEEQLGKLLRWFVDSKLYENTAIFLVSDHGVSLGEHGPAGHGVSCSEEIIHVPLYVYWPKSSSGIKEIHDLVSIVDIMPTILGEKSVGSGVNLFERENNRAVYFEFKRQRKKEGVPQEYANGKLPSYDIFVRGVRWRTYKLVYSRSLGGAETIKFVNYGEKTSQLSCIDEGWNKLCFMFPNFADEGK